MNARNDRADQPGEDDAAAAITVGAKDLIEAKLARGAEGCGDMAVWQAAGDGKGLAFGPQ